MKMLLASVAAAGLITGTATAQQIVLVPQGEGPMGMQQFNSVPIAQDQAQQGAGQQQGRKRGTSAGAELLIAQQTGASDMTFGVERDQQHGPYLADVHGRAVYMFTADKQAKDEAAKAVSNCYEACAQAWPPVLTEGTPVEAADPAKSDLLGTMERRDGSNQATYNGWPLYYYAKDSTVGEAKGQDVHGFGGEWYLLRPEGDKVEQD